jgi:hypothetical protein
MLHGGVLRCNISSWCNGVIDCDYLSRCDIDLTSDVVLNGLCDCSFEYRLHAIAPA